MYFNVLEKAKLSLDKYIYLITGTSHNITLEVEPGLFCLEDPEQDDAYIIDVEGGKGTIKASNPRAALIGVYHLLRDNGCYFVRPGKESERITRKPIEEITSKRKVEAKYRFRGICIEGACSLESVIELLEWMPKVGLNCYFMQFKEGYNFFERWYECTDNDIRSPWEFNEDICSNMLPQIVYTAHSNGLMYHAVGHGFTCEAYGVPSLGWLELDWPDEYIDVLAQRNGKRDLSWNMPLISALCYSREDVQKRIIDYAVNYIEEHPEIDYLHFWLDDGHNNKCECDRCKNIKIADLYIKMLNTLDYELTKRGLNTKIVFLAYHELLWTPDKEKLKNPNRFTFMFAPIQRSFLQPLPLIEEAGEPKKYNLNKQPFPQNNYEMAAHLKAWTEYRKMVGMSLSDSFDFDYYLNDYNDPGQFIQTRLIYEDIQNLKKNGLGGLINCQSQRLFDHAALPQYVMARALQQPELSLDEIVDEFFFGAFGNNYEVYKKEWLKLTEASAPLRDKENMEFDKLKEVLAAPLPEEQCKDLTTSHSRKLMKFTKELFLMLTDMTEQAVLGNDEKVKEIQEKINRYTSEKESEFIIELDRNYFKGAMERLLKEKLDKENLDD